MFRGISKVRYNFNTFVSHFSSRSSFSVQPIISIHQIIIYILFCEYTIIFDLLNICSAFTVNHYYLVRSHIISAWWVGGREAYRIGQYLAIIMELCFATPPLFYGFLCVPLYFMRTSSLSFSPLVTAITARTAIHPSIHPLKSTVCCVVKLSSTIPHLFSRRPPTEGGVWLRRMRTYVETTYRNVALNKIIPFHTHTYAHEGKSASLATATSSANNRWRSAITIKFAIVLVGHGLFNAENYVLFTMKLSYSLNVTILYCDSDS